MKFKIKKEWYSNYFIDFLKNKNRYQILYGGRGSGKTHHIILKLIAVSFLTEYNHIIYVNKVFSDIRKNQFKDIIKILKATNLYDYFSINKTNYGFKNTITGTEFTALGMDNAENTKGLSDPTIIWWDEINKGTLEDFTTLNALLRTPLNKTHQFIISFNPVSEQHWLRNYFFDKENAYQLNDNFISNTYINHSTYLHNDFIDKNEYLKTLEANALGNINRMLVDIEGRWGIITNKNPFFYSYKTEKHFVYSEYQITNNNYIDISFDFNITPCTAILGEFDIKSLTWNIFDVILADQSTFNEKSSLEALCTLIKRKYLDTGIVNRYRIRITGDASGKSGNADRTAVKSFYYKIMDILGINQKQIYVRGANIPHQMSGVICNDVLYKLPIKLWNTKLLEDDINLAYIDDKGTLNESKKEFGLHITDSFRYLLDFWFSYTNHWLKDIKKIQQNISIYVNRYGHK